MKMSNKEPIQLNDVLIIAVFILLSILVVANILR